MIIETLLGPAELPALAQRDLSTTACVVFDILRATSTFVTALHHGAEEIIPVSEIAEALALRRQRAEVLLAGERNGVRIGRALTGGVDFDLGNSPHEFLPAGIGGKSIVSTTTNGTRALRACEGAQVVLAGAFLNLTATANRLRQLQPKTVLLVCAGTGEGVALEDVLAAGALAAALTGEFSDATEIAARTFAGAEDDLVSVLAGTQNARRLLAIPALREDVAFCAQRDVFALVAEMQPDGALRRS